MTTRAEAKLEGLNKYNTGNLCKNGHYSDRYTQSGTCITCLHGEKVQPLENTQQTPDEILKNVALRKKTLAEEIRKVRCTATASDWEAIRKIAFDSVIAKFPFLTEDDALSAKQPTHDKGHYNFYVLKYLPEDKDMLQQLERCFQKLSPDLALHAEIESRRVHRLAEAETTTYENRSKYE